MGSARRPARCSRCSIRTIPSQVRRRRPLWARPTPVSSPWAFKAMRWPIAENSLITDSFSGVWPDREWMVAHPEVGPPLSQITSGQPRSGAGLKDWGREPWPNFRGCADSHHSIELQVRGLVPATSGQKNRLIVQWPYAGRMWEVYWITRQKRRSVYESIWLVCRLVNLIRAHSSDRGALVPWDPKCG
jgi:hypothetical protein